MIDQQADQDKYDDPDRKVTDGTSREGTVADYLTDRRKITLHKY